ncbi:Protein phosphatase 2C 16 [Cardamine amara subsp. amara]|uniref:protein-serine/threonine phosphatase n=1 Tax=Cardamine amara subsp. amara TaxID=228776 RepID=A0ABD1BKE8_CARAN
MEEMTPAVAMTLSLANTMCDSSPVEITQLKNVTDAADLLSDQENQTFYNGGTDSIMEDVEERAPGLLKTLSETRSESSSTNICDEDEVLSVVEDTSAVISEGLLVVDAGSELRLSDTAMEIENGRVLATAIIVGESSIEQVPTAEVVIKGVNQNTNMEDGSGVVTASEVVIRLPEESNNHVTKGRSVYELDCIPLWGTVSIQGMSPSLTHLTGHFFGVYDGHGGHQVADYCRDRLHFSLAEEIERIKDELCNRNTGEGRQVQWEKVFNSCFLTVDGEIGGKMGRAVVGSSDKVLEAVASETVGSTAVVALVCSSHIVVSNCGDSRAVLFRGKEAMPLSVDHKPDREDEYERIENAGGKVIQWQGARVFGVLAMSRSIGDRYLKPYVIPEPEVTFMPRSREDECLILASDGLWDVMSNQEACELARRRILAWHKKHGAPPLAERGKGVDPACQAAAEFLSGVALQKGSKDNISIIVVDLKAQRKFKTRS